MTEDPEPHFQLDRKLSVGVCAVSLTAWRLPRRHVRLALECPNLETRSVRGRGAVKFIEIHGLSDVSVRIMASDVARMNRLPVAPTVMELEVFSEHARRNDLALTVAKRLPALADMLGVDRFPDVVTNANLPADPRLGHGPAQFVPNDPAHRDTEFLVGIDRFLESGCRLRLFLRNRDLGRDDGRSHPTLPSAPGRRPRDQDCRADERAQCNLQFGQDHRPQNLLG